MDARSDVLVLGGGLVGSSAAFFLRRRGLSVTLLERERVGRQASGVNFGNVRRQGRALAQVPLANRARAVWGQAQALLGEDLEFEPLGHLRVGWTDERADAFEQHARDVRALGLELEVLGREQLAARYGLFAPGIVAGSLSPRDGHANPRLAGPAFARAARREGAEVIEDAEVAHVARTGSEGYAVQTRDGRTFRAARLLLACGAWSQPLAAQLGEQVVIQARGPQMGVTEPLPWAIGPSIGVSTHVKHEGLYFRQVRRGNVVFGGGLHGPASTETGLAQVLPHHTLGQLHELRRIAPRFAQVQLIRVWSGVEGYTTDLQPVMGATSLPGAYVAFGFCGEGFALGPGVGDVMAELIDTGATSTPIDAFSPARFRAAG